jgi:hypothetical protein
MHKRGRIRGEMEAGLSQDSKPPSDVLRSDFFFFKCIFIIYDGSSCFLRDAGGTRKFFIIIFISPQAFIFCFSVLESPVDDHGHRWSLGG